MPGLVRLGAADCHLLLETGITVSRRLPCRTGVKLINCPSPQLRIVATPHSPHPSAVSLLAFIPDTIRANQPNITSRHALSADLVAVK